MSREMSSSFVPVTLRPCSLHLALSSSTVTALKGSSLFDSVDAVRLTIAAAAVEIEL